MVLLGCGLGFSALCGKVLGISDLHFRLSFRVRGDFLVLGGDDCLFANDVDGLTGEGGHSPGNGHRGYGIPFVERQNTPVKTPEERWLIRADFNQPRTAVQTQALHLERLFCSEGIDDVYLYCV